VKKATRNKSNASFEAMQYRQVVYPIAPLPQQKNFPTYVHVVQKLTIIRAQKIGFFRGLKFETLLWCHLAA